VEVEFRYFAGGGGGVSDCGPLVQVDLVEEDLEEFQQPSSWTWKPGTINTGGGGGGGKTAGGSWSTWCWRFRNSNN
jgi:hypothetical protein